MKPGSKPLPYAGVVGGLGECGEQVAHEAGVALPAGLDDFAGATELRPRCGRSQRGLAALHLRQPAVQAEETIERIRLTKSLQALGFTLDEVVDALDRLDAGDATCASERWRFEQVLDRIDAKLTELRRIRRDVVRVLEASHAGHCEICDGRIR